MCIYKFANRIAHLLYQTNIPRSINLYVKLLVENDYSTFVIKKFVYLHLNTINIIVVLSDQFWNICPAQCYNASLLEIRFPMSRTKHNPCNNIFTKKHAIWCFVPLLIKSHRL